MRFVIGMGGRPKQCRVSNLVCLSKIHWPSSPISVISIYKEIVAIVIIGMAEELSVVSPERFTLGPTCIAKSNPSWPVGRSSSRQPAMRNLALGLPYSRRIQPGRIWLNMPLIQVPYSGMDLIRQRSSGAEADLRQRRGGRGGAGGDPLEIRSEQGGQGGHFGTWRTRRRQRSGESAKQSKEHDCSWRDPSEHPGHQAILAKF